MSDFRYALKGVDVAQVDDAVNAIWNDLRSGVDSDALRSLGVDTKDLPVNRSSAFRLEQAGSGLTGVELSVLVAPLLALSEQVLRDVWTHLVLPRLIERFGRGSLKSKE